MRVTCLPHIVQLRLSFVLSEWKLLTLFVFFCRSCLRGEVSPVTRSALLYPQPEARLFEFQIEVKALPGRLGFCRGVVMTDHVITDHKHSFAPHASIFNCSLAN